MRNARLRLSPDIYNVDTNRGSYNHDDDEDMTEEASIYHQPSRLQASRQNKSCGTLCQYENYHKQDIRFSNNFGSTPLFNIPTLDPPPRVPPISHSFTTNFNDSCPYGYSTPLQTATMKTLSESEVSENFYAASDIFQVSEQFSTGTKE